MRVALVANSRSGAGTDGDALVQALRRRGARVRLLAVEEIGGAGAVANAERVVVAGGDGTIGPAARAAARAGVPLAVVSTGTANDFARALGLPPDREEEALDLAVDPAAATTRVELLRAGERPFVNAASTGLSVVAAAAARPLKRSLGALAYAAGAAWAGLSAQPLPVRVHADGRLAFAGRVWQVIVGGTGAFGGGSGLAHADPRDGLLDVVIVPAGARAGLLRHAWAMRSHRLEGGRDVRHLRAHRVGVEVPPATLFNVDGEPCHLHPAEFAAEPEPVEVVIPS